MSIKPLVIIVASITCLLVIAVADSQHRSSDSAASTPVAATPGPDTYEATAGKPGTKAFTLKLDKNVISEGPSMLTVKRNDPVYIQVTSGTDQPTISLTIDGYNQQSIVAYNAIVSMEFRAIRSGTYPIRLTPDGAIDNSLTTTIGTFVVE